MAIRSSILAALGAKAALGGAVVALAAGAAVGTAATHSVNPVNWGQHVVDAVRGCQEQAHPGACVSDVAQEHGEQVRAAHSEKAEKVTASPSPKPGQREGQTEDASPSASGNGLSTGNHGQGPAGPPASPGAASNRGDGSRGHDQPSPLPSTRG